MNDSLFNLESPFQPQGDQEQAIFNLTKNINDHVRNQVLLGITGSGKTFTMAQVIQKTQKPTIILAHNKTLAAQLFSEMKGFFPQNAVEYFVSFYDYYQPEAYIPHSQTYIEKDSSINEQIDRMRHAATRALLERRDVIIIASVSCIYGIGDPETYSSSTLKITKSSSITRKFLFESLVSMQYKRNDINFTRGTFRVCGDSIDIFPSHLEDEAWRITMFGDTIETIEVFDSLTGRSLYVTEFLHLYPNSHYVIPKPSITSATTTIRKEMEERIAYFQENNRLVEAQRIKERTQLDLEFLLTTGYCNGIENYSRHFTGKKPGEPPPTLLDYLQKDGLLIVDESHVTVPQIHAMYRGDQARKSNLAYYGFRLPSCMDNRPLTFEEWDQKRPQTIFVSATPAPWEIEQSQPYVTKQIIRPTGILDPICIVRPVANQVDDLLKESQECVKNSGRVLVTTLTKKMAEKLAEHLSDLSMNVRYIHSDIDTPERVKIIAELRSGVIDILIGINLLREGLDIPECVLVAILDADKEGFLRSKTALIQTIGRAARHPHGRVILYADKMTQALRAAITETEERRAIQEEYNRRHNITPVIIETKILTSLYENRDSTQKGKKKGKTSILVKHYLEKLESLMNQQAKLKNFEIAAKIRDEIKKIRIHELDTPLMLEDINQEIYESIFKQ